MTWPRCAIVVLMFSIGLAVVLVSSWMSHQAPAEPTPKKSHLSDEDKAVLTKLDSFVSDDSFDELPSTTLRERVPDPIIEVHNRDFDHMLSIISMCTKTEIYVNWTALKAAGIRSNTPVTFALKKPTFRQALEKTLERASTFRTRLRYTVEDGMIVIWLVPAPRSPAARVVAPALPRELDKKFPEIDFAGQSLGDVFEFFQDISGLRIVANWTALKTAGITSETPVSIHVQNPRFSVVLRLVLESLSDGKTPLECSFKDGTITVTATPRPDARKN